MSESRESQLEITLNEYRNQLSSVIAAINGNANADTHQLQALKTSLEELIAFTEVDLISVKKQSLLERLNACDDHNSDDIYCVFDSHNNNAHTNTNASTSSSSTVSSNNKCLENEEQRNDNDELMRTIRSMNGSKCMAPFVEQNGTVLYHNAIIMITDDELDHTSNSSECDITVKVLFTNPICESMKPCVHYLSGKCRYSDLKCRYSHGHRVSFANIKPYEEVDHSSLSIDTVCLAKCESDQLWYKAVIDDYREDTQKFVVKYLKHDIVDTVDIEHLLPLNVTTSDSDSSDISSSDDDSSSNKKNREQQQIKPIIPTKHSRSTSALGEWEMHTKGIGSKLMRKMGYVFGDGLGKNGEGRTDPIEVTVFPMGKSLDVCMRIRERKAGKDPLKERRKLNAKKAAINAKIASGYNYTVKKASDSVFDFINNKVAKSGVKTGESDNKDDAANRLLLPVSKLKSNDNQKLNVLSLQISEQIGKADIELNRLLCAIETRKLKTRERETVAHLEAKVVAQRAIIASLYDQERNIQRELKQRSNNKKLEVF